MLHWRTRFFQRLVCRSEEGSRCLEALSNLFLGKKKAIFSGENLSQWRTIESHTRGETITVVLVTLDFCAWKLIRALPSSAQAFWMVLSHDLSIHKRKYNVTFNKNLLSYHIVRLFSNRWQTSKCDRKISDTPCCAWCAFHMMASSDRKGHITLWTTQAFPRSHQGG